MKFSQLALSLLATFVAAQNSTSANANTTILVTNDDSWASANIRSLYGELKKQGYNVFMMAPAVQQSGTGGTFNLPRNKTLPKGGEFGSVPVDAPAWGQDKEDDHIWYFDGSPAAAMTFGLDYAIPNFHNNVTVDLVVSGPNEGNNLGPWIYTVSGTDGAMYTSLLRGIPAIAFSGQNTHEYYLNASTSDTAPHNIYAKAATDIVNTLVESGKDRLRLLPYSVGLSVNFPRVGDIVRSGTCTNPKPVFTRQTGRGAYVAKVVFNETTGMFAFGLDRTPATAACIHGDCLLPDESDVMTTWGCYSSVSVVTADYDAPRAIAAEAQFYLRDLVSFAPTGFGAQTPLANPSL